MLRIRPPNAEISSRAGAAGFLALGLFATVSLGGAEAQSSRRVEEN